MWKRTTIGAEKRVDGVSGDPLPVQFCGHVAPALVDPADLQEPGCSSPRRSQPAQTRMARATGFEYVFKSDGRTNALNASLAMNLSASWLSSFALRDHKHEIVQHGRIDRF